MSGRIVHILPRREGFSPTRFGAIALSVEDYVRHSAYHGITEVLGSPVDVARDPAVFRPIEPKPAWWRRKTLDFAAGCAAYLAANPPRHIDVHNRIEVFTALAKRFPQAATSLWLHNDPQTMRGAKTARERQAVMDRAQYVFCVSDWVRRRFTEGLTRHQERAVVLPGVLDVRESSGVPKQPVILYAGRIIEDKGVLLLADALARALPALPGWRAEIIGSGTEAEAAYERQVRAVLAPLGDRVALPGFVPHGEIMAAFTRAAIAVVPSLWEEPFGRTALEALASGCTVIATPRGGLPEVIGDVGIPLDPATPEHLADLLTTLATDDARRATLHDKAIAHAAAAFGVQRWAGYLDGLRKAIDPTLP